MTVDFNILTYEICMGYNDRCAELILKNLIFLKIQIYKHWRRTQNDALGHR